jgi:hypothetical protein
MSPEPVSGSPGEAKIRYCTDPLCAGHKHPTFMEHCSECWSATAAQQPRKVNPPSSPGLVGEFERLQAMHSAGALTDGEFAAAKGRLLQPAPSDLAGPTDDLPGNGLSGGCSACGYRGTMDVLSTRSQLTAGFVALTALITVVVCVITPWVAPLSILMTGIFWVDRFRKRVTTVRCPQCQAQAVQQRPTT